MIAVLLVAIGLLITFSLVVLWLVVRLAFGGIAAVVVLTAAFCGIVWLIT